VRVEFVKEHLAFTGDDAPLSTLMLSVMGAFAEFERALMKERQREGIAIAKKKGVYRGRRRLLCSDEIDELCRRARSAESIVKLAEEYGVSRQTVYRYLRDGGAHSPQP
jgi:DNA invertase Pin-like site-specific DNA recombinase